MSTLYIRYPQYAAGSISPGAFPLLAPNGTAGAPSYSFSSSPTTGMYSPGTNQLAFSTNGVRAALFDANQNFTLGSVNSSVHTINAIGAVVNNQSLVLANPSADGFIVCREVNTSSITIAGGGSGANGAVLNLFGASAAGSNASAWSIDDRLGGIIRGNGDGSMTFGSSLSTIDTIFGGEGGIFGSSLQLHVSTASGGADSAGRFTIARSVNNGILTLSGASAGSTGATISLYGNTHASLANNFKMDLGSTQNVILGTPTGLSTSVPAGINIASRTDSVLTIGGSPTTSVSQYGSILDWTSTSAATSSLIGYESTIRTPAAAFTATYATPFNSDTLTLGAGSSVGNFINFLARVNTNASNNCAFSDTPTLLSGNYFIYQSGSSPSSFKGPTAIGGTATNNNAAAGFVGEYVESVISTYTNVPGASAAWGNMASISLTAGDWDVTGLANFIANGATVPAGIDADEIAISVNSGNTTTDHVQGSNQLQTLVPSSATDHSGSIPAYRLSLSATTTVYFKVIFTYSVATPQYKCRLSARRMR